MKSRACSLMKKIYFLFFAFFICLNAESQTASRVIAFAKYEVDTTIPCADSGGYIYSKGRSGEIYSNLSGNFESNYPFVFVPKYDFETGHCGLTKCDSSWELSKTDTDISTQFFDENDNIIYSSCKIFNLGKWHNYDTRSCTYDKNNNLLQQIDSFGEPGSGLNIVLKTFNYDQNNRLLSINNLPSDTNSISNWRSQYIYDVGGKLVNLESRNWDMSDRKYTTDSFTFFYKANKPDSVTIYVDKYPSTYGKYYFSIANDTMIVNYYPPNSMRRINTYDIHNNKTSSIQEVLDPRFVSYNNYKTEWSYNAFNQVTCERNYTRDPSGKWIFSNLTRYYYETYTPEVPFIINNLEVFPSPAKNSVTIKLEWDKSQPFTIMIFDAVGRLVMQWNEHAKQKYEKTINLPDMASGDYLIRAIGGKQKLVKKFVIIN